MPIDSAPKPNTTEGKEKLSLRVLLAEDNDALREMEEELLGEKGYEVVAVNNGQLLLDQLLDEGQSWDLVITDNSMPGINGIEVIQKIRQIERFRNIPVVLQTSDVVKDLTNTFKELNVVYLAKPFRIEKLYGAIDQALVESEPS